MNDVPDPSENLYRVFGDWDGAGCLAAIPGLGGIGWFLTWYYAFVFGGKNLNPPWPEAGDSFTTVAVNFFVYFLAFWLFPTITVLGILLLLFLTVAALCEFMGPLVRWYFKGSSGGEESGTDAEYWEGELRRAREKKKKKKLGEQEEAILEGLEKKRKADLEKARRWKEVERARRTRIEMAKKQSPAEMKEESQGIKNQNTSSTRSAGKIKVPCPGCKKVLNCPVQMAGKAGKCPHCSAKFKIPIPKTV